MKSEKQSLYRALVIPAILLFIMWTVKLVELGFDISLSHFGVHPLHWNGLPGILTMPFVHGDMKHLLANSGSFIILATALFYFYREISLKVLIGIWVLSGIWVWFGGRESWHIGASGIIYGLSSFLFFSGLIRKNTQLAALAMIVAFLYGSMVWGIFPDFFPNENISWEGHLGGFAAGIILTFYFRNIGPKPKKYSWDIEGDDEEEDDDNAYWNRPQKNPQTTK